MPYSPAFIRGRAGRSTGPAPGGDPLIGVALALPPIQGVKGRPVETQRAVLRRPTGIATSVGARYVLRLSFPPLAALVAFPAVGAEVVRVARDGGFPALTLAAVLASGLAIVLMRQRPRADEPAVHDRQLDAILAIPLGVLSIWLAAGWTTPLSVDQPLTNRLIVAATAFLAAACLLVLGTRLTARIRWAILSPLLALPALTGWGPAGAAAAWALVAITALSMARWLHHDGYIGGGDRATDPPGLLRRGGDQLLPATWPATYIVGTSAVLMGLFALLPEWGTLS